MQMCKLFSRTFFTFLVLGISFGIPKVYADFSTTNTNLRTLQIYDRTDEVGCYGLVNDYFGLSVRNAYTSSNALYADRGVKDANLLKQIGTGGQGTIIGLSKNSLFTLGLNATYANGTTLAGGRIYSDGERYDRVFRDALISLNYGENFKGWSLDVTNGAGNFTYYSDASKNLCSLISMIAFDVTDLMRLKTGNMNITSAYMVGWEDGFNTSLLDYDYQDIAYIIVNTGSSSDVPEPATALLWGLGTLTVGGTGYFRSRKKRTR